MLWCYGHASNSVNLFTMTCTHALPFFFVERCVILKTFLLLGLTLIFLSCDKFDLSRSSNDALRGRQSVIIIEVFNINMVAAALNDHPDLRIYSRPCHRFQLSPRRSFRRSFHRLSNTTIIGSNNFRITYYIMYIRSSTIYKTYIYKKKRF